MTSTALPTVTFVPDYTQTVLSEDPNRALLSLLSRLQTGESDGDVPPAVPNLPKQRMATDIAWGSSGKDARFFNELRRQLGRMHEEDRRLLLFMAQKMSRHVAGRQGAKS